MSALHRTAACEHGIDCKSDKAGHAMSFMRLRCAHVDKASWLDASVVAFEGEWVELESWADGHRFSAWNHEDLRVDLDVNELVSVNTTYGVLALGERRINVALLIP